MMMTTTTTKMMIASEEKGKRNNRVVVSICIRIYSLQSCCFSFARERETFFFLRVVGGREFVRCLGQTNTPLLTLRFFSP